MNCYVYVMRVCPVNGIHHAISKLLTMQRTVLVYFATKSSSLYYLFSQASRNSRCEKMKLFECPASLLIKFHLIAMLTMVTMNFVLCVAGCLYKISIKPSRNLLLRVTEHKQNTSIIKVWCLDQQTRKQSAAKYMVQFISEQYSKWTLHFKNSNIAQA